ncbi:MAG: hypothetical protein ACRDP7_50185 [Trebonia sp.]
MNHPELLSSLATEHRRDLDSDVITHRAPRAAGVRRTRPVALPKLRVSWTRTTLNAVAGHRRGKSVVIVISATRTL